MSLERATDEEFGADPILELEHVHRYVWASNFAKGVILDVACGAGLLSSYLESNAQVSGYVGVDNSLDALKSISGRSSDMCSFVTGELSSLPLASDSFDVVISLETLEHVRDLEACISEIARVLRPGGLFVGSIPSYEKEVFNNERWGENPYHVDILTRERFDSVLKDHFQHRSYAMQSLQISSTVGPFEGAKYNHIRTLDCAAVDRSVGSLMFVACSRPLVYAADSDVTLIVGPEFVTSYAKMIEGMEQRAYKAEALAVERWEIMKNQERSYLELRGILSSAERIIQEKDALIKLQEQLLADQAQVLGRLEGNS